MMPLDRYVEVVVEGWQEGGYDRAAQVAKDIATTKNLSDAEVIQLVQEVMSRINERRNPCRTGPGKSRRP
jgi:hypothetical protein